MRLVSLPAPCAEPHDDQPKQQSDDHRLHGDVEPDARDGGRGSRTNDRHCIPEKAHDCADDEAHEEIHWFAGHTGTVEAGLRRGQPIGGATPCTADVAFAVVARSGLLVRARGRVVAVRATPTRGAFRLTKNGGDEAMRGDGLKHLPREAMRWCLGEG